jgi:hypothetical protein
MKPSSAPVFGPAFRGRPFLEAIEASEKLFARMGEKIAPVVGEMTLKSILTNMLEYAAEKHGCLSKVEQQGVRVDFSGLKDAQSREQQDQSLSAIEFFFGEFIQLMSDLTSDSFTESLGQMAREAFAEEGA